MLPAYCVLVCLTISVSLLLMTNHSIASSFPCFPAIYSFPKSHLGTYRCAYTDQRDFVYFYTYIIFISIKDLVLTYIADLYGSFSSM